VRRKEGKKEEMEEGRVDGQPDSVDMAAPLDQLTILLTK